MCDFKTFVEIAKNISEIVALLVAAIVAFRINWKFIPIIKLDIANEWLDKKNGKLKLTLSIENKSNVKAVKQKVRLQILHYKVDQLSILSEWVPFEENKVHLHEQPVIWNEPIYVWRATEAIYPGEITTLDYMCECPPGT